MLTWNFKGWDDGKSNHIPFIQFNWNSTLITMLNIAAKQSHNENYVLVVVPSHLRKIIEPNVALLKGDYKWDLIYRNRDQEVIEVNGVEINILNFDGDDFEVLL